MDVKMLFLDALPLIRNFAPTIASAIGGPFGFAAGYIIPILASAFGSNPQDLRDLSQRIMSDPEAEQKLKLVEHDHGSWLSTLLSSVSNLASAEINVKLAWDKKDNS